MVNLFIRKSVETLQDEANNSTMKRSLNGLDVMLIGVGEIIGAGIFVITGTAAAKYAGPAIVLSFVLSGICCAFAGLCYSEMASMVPSSGSAYVYAYASVGELVGWIIGWDLMLEYLIGAATVAVGWSGYLVNFIEQITGSKISPTWVNGPWQFSEEKGFYVDDEKAGILNLPAIFISLFCTTILVFGIRQSAVLNHALVGIKIAVILLFLCATFGHIDPANWTPFIPPPDQDHEYGWNGVIRASTMVFFAYIGFDAVSTVAQETKKPSRDMPIGVLGSLVVCTVLYILVCLNLTGCVNYKLLDTPAPIADAVTKLNMGWLRVFVNIAGIAGLTSVILVSLMGQPRVFWSMATDGLLPPVFAKIHPKYGTPFVPTIFSGIFCAVAAGLLPLDVLGDITSAGTLFAFFIVCVSVTVLRYTRPDVERKFRVPLGPIVIPMLGAAACMFLIIKTGWATIARLLIWMAVGFCVYFGYGYRHSRLRNNLPPLAVAQRADDSKIELEDKPPA